MHPSYRRTLRSSYSQRDPRCAPRDVARDAIAGALVLLQLEVPIEAVLRDGLNGFVSLEAARADYGVVIRRLAPDDETVLLPEDFAVDEAATSALRSTPGPAQHRRGQAPRGGRG